MKQDSTAKNSSTADSLWQTRSRNRATIDLLGPNVIGSLGYERLIINRPKHYWLARLSAGVIWFGYSNETEKEQQSFTTLSLSLSHVHRIGKNSSLEYGLAVTGITSKRRFVTSYPQVSYLRAMAGMGMAGFRWQRPSSSFFYRIVACPSMLYTFIEGDLRQGLYFFPTLGLTMGYGFKRK